MRERGLQSSSRMNANALESLLREATIKAIDGVAKKVTEAESLAEKNVTRLLTKWKEMEPEQKEHVAGIAIATITTAVTAIIALSNRNKKSPLKTAARNLARSVGMKS